MKENVDQQPKDSEWTNLINDIINKKPESGDATIQPLKSPAMSETAKNLNICSTKSEELSEDESLVDHPLVKKKRLNSTDAASSIRSENSKPSLIDELNGMSFRNKDTDTGKVQKDESEEIEDDNEQDVDRIKDDTTQILINIGIRTTRYFRNQ